MNTLEKICKQDLVVANETAKLIELQKQYVEENSIYKKGDVVTFLKYENSGLKLGEVAFLKYNNAHGKGLIQLILRVVNLDGTRSKNDPGFYYKWEKEIILKKK